MTTSNTKDIPTPPSWKGFATDVGWLLLHTPSAHVMEVEREIFEHVEGINTNEEIAAQLDELASTLPEAPKRPELKVSIAAASLNMAQGCNLRCVYCFAGEGDYGKKSMMKPETAIKALEILADGKSKFHVVFFGGEPILNFSTIEQVVAWCESNTTTKFSFAITTNGTLLTEKKLQWMRDKGFSMNLSYDGPKLQGAQRLNKDLVSNSEALVTKKLDSLGTSLSQLRSFQLRATVTREHMDLLFDSVLTTLTSTNYKMFVSHHASPFKAMSFTSEDVEKLEAVYMRLVDYFAERKDFETLLRLRNIRNWINTIHDGRVHKIACGAGIDYLTVSTEGEFFLCHRFNEVKEEKYGDLSNGLDRKRLQDIIEFRQGKKDPCASCWMLEWCAGGCMHEHYAGTGDKFGMDPLYCQLQETEIKVAMRVYHLLMDQKPELLSYKVKEQFSAK